MAKRNIRTIQHIEKTLRAADGPLSTLEIHERICNNWPRTASSTNVIGNLLARHNQFVKLDYDVDYYYAGGSKPVHVWELSEDDSTRRDEKDGERKNA
jgi:hypothetical protein